MQWQWKWMLVIQPWRQLKIVQNEVEGLREIGVLDQGKVR